MHIIIINFIIIIKLFKGIHKRRMPVQGDTLTYNPYSYTTTITKTRQHIHDTITKTKQRNYKTKQSHYSRIGTVSVLI